MESDLQIYSGETDAFLDVFVLCLLRATKNLIATCLSREKTRGVRELKFGEQLQLLQLCVAKIHFGLIFDFGLFTASG